MSERKLESSLNVVSEDAPTCDWFGESLLRIPGLLERSRQLRSSSRFYCSAPARGQSHHEGHAANCVGYSSPKH